MASRIERIRFVRIRRWRCIRDRAAWMTLRVSRARLLELPAKRPLREENLGGQTLAFLVTLMGEFGAAACLQLFQQLAAALRVDPLFLLRLHLGHARFAVALQLVLTL